MEPLHGDWLIDLFNELTSANGEKLLNHAVKDQAFEMQSHEATNTYQASQPAFTCSKLTITTLEQGVKYANNNNKKTDVVLVSLLLTFNKSHTLLQCFYC